MNVPNFYRARALLAFIAAVVAVTASTLEVEAQDWEDIYGLLPDVDWRIELRCENGECDAVVQRSPPRKQGAKKPLSPPPLHASGDNPVVGDEGSSISTTASGGGSVQSLFEDMWTVVGLGCSLTPGLCAQVHARDDIPRSTLPRPDAGAQDNVALSSDKTDPVNIVTGEFVHHATDIRLPGLGGTGFSFDRVYRSGTRYDGPLGHGWDHNWNQKLIEFGDSCYGELPNPLDCMVLWATGRGYTLSFSPAEGFETSAPCGAESVCKTTSRTFRVASKADVPPGSDPASEDNALTSFSVHLDAERRVDTDGTVTVVSKTWRLQHPAGSRAVFDADGRLERVVDSVGNSVTVSWEFAGPEDEDWRVERVVDSVGREISFIYDLQSHLLFVGDVSSAVSASYTYNARGELVTAVNDRGVSETYGYESEVHPWVGAAGDAPSDDEFIPQIGLDATCRAMCSSRPGTSGACVGAGDNDPQGECYDRCQELGEDCGQAGPANCAAYCDSHEMKSHCWQSCSDGCADEGCTPSYIAQECEEWAASAGCESCWTELYETAFLACGGDYCETDTSGSFGFIFPMGNVGGDPSGGFGGESSLPPPVQEDSTWYDTYLELYDLPISVNIYGNGEGCKTNASYERDNFEDFSEWPYLPDYSSTLNEELKRLHVMGRCGPVAPGSTEIRSCAWTNDERSKCRSNYLRCQISAGTWHEMCPLLGDREIWDGVFPFIEYAGAGSIRAWDSREEFEAYMLEVYGLPNAGDYGPHTVQGYVRTDTNLAVNHIDALRDHRSSTAFPAPEEPARPDVLPPCEWQCRKELEASCAAELPQICSDNCEPDCAARCMSDCEGNCLAQFPNDCVQVAQNCGHHCDELGSDPGAWESFCEDGCYDSCVASNHRTFPAVGKPKYGRVSQLNHNLVSIKDGAGETYVVNVYGKDVTHPSFDRVKYHWYGGEWTQLGYADLLADPSAPAPSTGPTVEFAFAPALAFQNPEEVEDNQMTFSYSGLVEGLEDYESAVVCPDCDSADPEACRFGYGEAAHGDPTTLTGAEAPILAVVVKPPNGEVVTLYSDAHGQLIRKVEYPEGAAKAARQSTWYDYDDRFRLVGVEHDNGDRVCMTLDNDGDVVYQTMLPALGTLDNLAGTGDGPTAIVHGAQTYYAYVDGRDGGTYSGPKRLHKTHLPRRSEGEDWVVTSEMTWSALGLLEKVTDASGLETTYINNGLGWPERIIEPNGLVTEFVYDASIGVMTQVIKDPDGPDPAVTTIDSDLAGRPFRIVSPTGVETAIDRTVPFRDHLITVTDADSGRTLQRREIFNDEGELVTVEGDVLTQTFEYDLRGHLRRATTAAGDGTGEPLVQCTRMGLDGRLLERVMPDGMRLKYVYDGVGRPLQVHQTRFPDVYRSWDDACPTIDDSVGTAAETEVTLVTFEYDPDGRWVRTTDALGRSTTVERDLFGRPAIVTDHRGVVSHTRGTTGISVRAIRRRSCSRRGPIGWPTQSPPDRRAR